jgi:Icc-related predicted phosphoesterase
MGRFLFATDLHGHLDRYRALCQVIEVERPEAVLLGGDLLPGGFNLAKGGGDFIADSFAPRLAHLRDRLGASYPRLLLILGNDDPRVEEAALVDGERSGLWEYIHGRRVVVGKVRVYGYAFVPPTPFLLKDWERYDVSRYVDHGAVSPEEGYRSVPVDAAQVRWGTIARDLDRLVGDDDLAQAILLTHSPPYQTALDRAALDGRTVDGVPVDLHVGSIALRRLVEARQPLVGLHGHVHEAPRLTRCWHDHLGRTCLFTACHDGPELALVSFDPARPHDATRRLLA